MTMQLTIAILLLLALVNVEGAKNLQKCPKVLGKRHFDSSKPERRECVTFEHVAPTKLELDSTRTTNLTYIKNNQQFTDEIVWKVKSQEKPAISYAVVKSADTKKWGDVYKQTLISTDYAKYALSLACRTIFDETTKQFDRSLIATILSRTPKLDRQAMTTLKNVLSGLDIDVSTMIDKENKNCGAN
ncbi:hypothetical protein B566_EDAN007013 [Ephemera danica]|nr:hypothetical protein B566_EDAN007013 [Ephemera danica]